MAQPLYNLLIIVVYCSVNFLSSFIFSSKCDISYQTNAASQFYFSFHNQISYHNNYDDTKKVYPLNN